MSLFERVGRRQAEVPTLHVAVDLGEGPVVVLLHGIASSSASWRHLVPLVSPLYRVIAIDLLGFGGSRAGEHIGFTLDEHVEALHKTLRALHLRGRFTLVGHSLGALVSARYAAVHHRQIGHLVLVAPPVYPHRRYLDALGHRMRVGGYLWFYRFVRDNRLTIVNNAGRFSRWMPAGGLAIDDASWQAFSRSLEHCIEVQTTTTDLAQVRAPVDVVWGSRDQVIVPGSLELFGSMHHVTLHEIPRADHLLRLPVSREVARLLR